MQSKTFLLLGLFSTPFMVLNSNSILSVKPKVVEQKETKTLPNKEVKTFQSSGLISRTASNPQARTTHPQLSEAEKSKNLEYVINHIIPQLYYKTFFKDYVNNYKEKILNFIGPQGTKINDGNSGEFYYREFKLGNKFNIGANHKNTMIWKKGQTKKIPDIMWEEAFSLNLIKVADLLNYFQDYLEPGSIIFPKVTRKLVKGHVEDEITIKTKPISIKGESLLFYDEKIKTQKDLTLNAKEKDSKKNHFTFALINSLKVTIDNEQLIDVDEEYNNHLEHNQKVINDFVASNYQKYFNNYKNIIKLIINESVYKFKVPFNPDGENKFLPAFNPRPNLVETELLKYRKRNGDLAPYTFNDIEADEFKIAFETNAKTQSEIEEKLKNWISKTTKIYQNPRTNEMYEAEITDDKKNLHDFDDYYQELNNNPDINKPPGLSEWKFSTYNDLMGDAFDKAWNDEDSLFDERFKTNLQNIYQFKDQMHKYAQQNIFTTKLGQKIFANYKNSILATIKENQSYYYADESKYLNLITEFNDKTITKQSPSYNFYEKIRDYISIRKGNIFSWKQGQSATTVPEEVFQQMFLNNVFTMKDIFHSPLGNYIDLGIITIKGDQNLSWYNYKKGQDLTLLLFGSENLQKRTSLNQQITGRDPYNQFINFPNPLGIKSIMELFTDWHYVDYWIIYDDAEARWVKKIIPFFPVNTYKDDIQEFLDDWIAHWDNLNEEN